MSLNYGATGLAVLALLVAWGLTVGFDDGYVAPMIASLGLIVVVPMLFYPYSKTTWAAIDLLLHHMDRADIEEAWREGDMRGGPPGS